MNRLRHLVVLCALLSSLPPLTPVAHADLLRRALDGDAEGGGTTPNPVALDGLASWAGAPTVATLGEIIKATVDFAPSLASAKFDIQIAEAQIEQTRGRDDWRLQAKLEASRSSGGVFSGFSVERSTTVTGAFDALRALPTGGTIDLHAQTQYSNTKLESLPESKQWFDTISASINQPLLKGRGRELYEANERRARVVRDGVILGRRLAAIQVVQAVVSAYWDLVLAERQIAITQQSLDLANERLRITTLGAQGGKIAKAEIPAVEQIIATREEDVLSGELLILDRSIAVRRASGMAIGAGQLALRVDAALDIPELTPALGELVERAYQASPELAQLEKQTNVDTIEIEVTENGLLPQLDAALTLGPTGQDAKFATALKDLVTFDQFAITGSLTYAHTLGNEAVRGRAKELRLVREKRRVTAFDLRAQLAQTMARAVAQLELAKRRIVLSRRAITLANQNIQIETDRFNLGKSTNFDVLGRLEELRQSELRQVQAMVDWHKAQTVIMALTGDLLPTFGITLE
ncbi:MAG: TolC family protein [Proteobacteria bacterium]|nr:TolC family protein [Pseudomonadota bacterium]